MSDKCRSCGAEIIWIKTPEGKSMPLDAKPEKRWVENVADGHGVDYWGLEDTYVSHFATCPDAAKFRKPKDGGK